MQYNNGYNVQLLNSCNMDACKRCRNQFACSKYQQHFNKTNVSTPSVLSYAIQSTEENAIASAISNESAHNQSMQSEVDFSPIINLNKELKDFMIGVIQNKFAVLENQYNELINKMSVLSENAVKFDDLIKIIEEHNRQYETDINLDSDISNNGVTIYTGKAEESEHILVEKKGFFGLGKSKWVDEVKK